MSKLQEDDLNSRFKVIIENKYLKDDLEHLGLKVIFLANFHRYSKCLFYSPIHFIPP